MNLKGIALLFLAAVALSACATVPTGPSVRVLPGPGKPFEVFQSDDAGCRQWASHQAGAGASESANKTLASGAAVGTILGGGLGAAIGAASGHAVTGLGVGAASGAIVGTAAASGPAAETGREVQRRYDNAYMECMYAKGNQVPGMGPSRQAIAPSPPPVAVQPQGPPLMANVEPPPPANYPPPGLPPDLYGGPGTGECVPPCGPNTVYVVPGYPGMYYYPYYPGLYWYGGFWYWNRGGIWYHYGAGFRGWGRLPPGRVPFGGRFYGRR